MPLRYPTEFTNLRNFELAWDRIVRGSNVQYKRYFSHLFPSYTFASRTILRELISRIRSGTYQPSLAATIYIPKPSGILRPVTLLSLNDQVVYQAIANVIANRLYSSLRPHYGIRTFGALYGGRNSQFFYRSWKQSYRAFNSQIRKAYSAGNDILADFDLVSFFDLIDHEVLRKVLAFRLRSGELLSLLFECLGHWTQGNARAYKRGHGIPQGPEPSAFLAEIFLNEFDNSQFARVKYYRYVDDIKLLGKAFGPVNRALVKLDLHSKRLGLVPQAQKIAIRKVTNIAAELKAVPSNIEGPSGLRTTGAVTATTKNRLLRLLRRSIERRKDAVIVKDDTRLKFALYRLPAMPHVLRLVKPLLISRPDLSGVLGGYAARFSNHPKCANALYAALRADPVFDAAAGDYIMALDRCAPQPEPRKFRILISRLKRRSEEQSLALDVPAKLFTYERMGKAAVAAALMAETNPITVGLLLHRLTSGNYSVFTPKDFDIVIRHFAVSSHDADLGRYCTYLMLTELRLLPRRPQPSGFLLLKHLGARGAARSQSLLSGFFKDQFGLSTPLDWEQKLGKRAHSEAQRRANVIRGHWGGNPSVLITAIDALNDLLIQRFSIKHPALRRAFKQAAGPNNRIPDFGNWIRHPTTRTELPRASPILLNCHNLRLAADLAHAKLKKTGRFTRQITYGESSRMVRQLSPAYAELLTKWRLI